MKTGPAGCRRRLTSSNEAPVGANRIALPLGGEGRRVEGVKVGRLDGGGEFQPSSLLPADQIGQHPDLNRIESWAQAAL